jgi:hypothetical protein
MHHWEKTSSSTCVFAKSLLLATGKNILRSSAYKRMRNDLKLEKRANAPNEYPWGTPVLTENFLD